MSWGVLASINLYECNPYLIRNKTEIKEFLNKLCKRIGMKAYGPPIIKRFGEGSLHGNSAMQFIETSSITFHNDEVKNRVFLDIFSCKGFDAKEAEKFSKEFFKAKKTKMRVLIRD